jgi:CDP-diacylglycerol--glycerol-3-phosphate 3-phosphatidyltransferase
VLGALTDKLDGMVARARHEETEWGRVLDPLADKIGVAAIVLVLLALGDLPLWFVVAILARDLLILAGGLVVKARKGVVLPSNMVGKWSVGAISAILALRVPGFTGAGIDIAFTVLLIVTSAMLLWSLALYTRRFVEVFSSHGHS